MYDTTPTRRDRILIDDHLFQKRLDEWPSIFPPGSLVWALTEIAFGTSDKRISLHRTFPSSILTTFTLFCIATLKYSYHLTLEYYHITAEKSRFSNGTRFFVGLPIGFRRNGSIAAQICHSIGTHSPCHKKTFWGHSSDNFRTNRGSIRYIKNP